MAGAPGFLPTRALQLLAGLALLLVARGEESLPEAVAQLEALVRSQGARLKALEGQLQEAPEERRLALTGSDGTKSIYAGSARQYNAEDNFNGGMDHLWLILSAAMCFFMQAGFSMLEAGTCRIRNVQNVLMKNMLDVLVSCVAWFIFGYSFAYSGPFKLGGLKENGFMGWEQFAGHHFIVTRSDGQQEPSTALVKWFVSWTYCCVAATIATNGIAERADFPGYAIFTFFFSSVIFPIVVAWTWGGGWLVDMNASGFFDYGGSGVVHLSGGLAALVGAFIAGPRSGRFDAGGATSPDFSSTSPPLVVLGTFILWFGWYGYIYSFTGEMHKIETGMMAAQTAMNLTIAASTSALLAGVNYALTPRTEVSTICNALLAGLVSVSASAPAIEVGTACGLGVGAAVVYIATTMGLKVLKVDDPMDAFAVHGACGMWGLFGAGLMDWGLGFETFHGARGFRCIPYATGTNCNKEIGAAPLAANLAECFAIIGWVGALSAGVFLALKFAKLLKDECDWDENKHIPSKGFDVEDVMPKTSL